MMFVEVPTFGYVDYCVFGAMLLISVGIGIYLSFKGNKTPEDYLMGNRAFGPIPITMSLVTSHFSSISMLGYSGEVYGNGLELFPLIFGASFGILFTSVLTLPVLFPLKLTSVNEYIELRFKSPRLRGCITIFTCVNGFIYMGVCLYATSIALASITPLDSLTCIFLIGSVCSLYSTIGGIRAVVWTDVFQLTVLLIGLIAVTALGCADVGGLGEVWAIASEGGRTKLFNMNTSIYERHSFYNTILLGFTYYTAYYGISQINVQRMCSVRTLRDAKFILMFNVIGLFLVNILLFTDGLMVFASYFKCDPLMLGKIKKKEEILPYFIMDRLGYISGLSGLFAATIVGGGLSTLSSVISAQVAMIWKDSCKIVKAFDNASPTTAAIINKVLSTLVCVVLIGLAVIASHSVNLTQFAMMICSVILGPILGVFLLGILFPRCNVTGVWFGLFVSWLFLCWVSVGSLIYVDRPEMLPFSTEECNITALNVTSDRLNILSNIHQNSSVKDNVAVSSLGTSKYNFPLMNLYAISYTYYPFLGIVICLVIGMFVSYYTGLENVENVSPELTATFIRKFYWKKEQNGKWNHKEDKLIIHDLTAENETEDEKATTKFINSFVS